MVDYETDITTAPSYASSGIALLAGLCSMGLITTHPLQVIIVGIDAIGILIVFASSLLRYHDRRLGGLVFLGGGGLVVSLSLGLGTIFPIGLTGRSALVGGLLGPVLVLLGLYPLRPEWSRALVSLGVTLLICAIILQGWLTKVGQVRLLGAVMMVVLAWDAAEHAITLGREVGRNARTVAVSLTHSLGSLLVGLTAILVAEGLSGLSLSSIPTSSLGLLLGTLLLLLFALYLSDFAIETS